MTGDGDSGGLKSLEVGYWNVGWNTSSEWYGIEGQMDHVIQAMKSQNCDILFCTDARRPTEEDGFSTAVLNYGQGIGSKNFEGEEFKLFWIGEKDANTAKKVPGGTCVIWKGSFSEEQIKVNVIQTASTPSQRPTCFRSEITKHRILTVEVEAALGNVLFVCCYGIVNAEEYNKDKEERNKDSAAFFSEVERIIGGYKEKLIVVLGDINAQIGQNYIEILRDRTNNFHLDTNTRGQEFIEFCATKKLIVASALFPSASPTYKRNANDKGSYIDHFAIGWVNPKDKNWTEEEDAEYSETAGIRTLDANGNGICTNVHVTNEILPNAGENYHFLCVASLVLRKANNRKADGTADVSAEGNANGNVFGNSDANANGSANRSADESPEENANGNADGSANGTADGSAVGKTDANADGDIGEVANLLEAQALDDPSAST